MAFRIKRLCRVLAIFSPSARRAAASPNGKGLAVDSPDLAMRFATSSPLRRFSAAETVLVCCSVVIATAAALAIVLPVV
jgi:hypothetical protein